MLFSILQIFSPNAAALREGVAAAALQDQLPQELCVAAPVIAALRSPGGLCPRPLQPSPRHVLALHLGLA